MPNNSALFAFWLGGRKGIWPVEKWGMVEVHASALTELTLGAATKTTPLCLYLSQF